LKTEREKIDFWKDHRLSDELLKELPSEKFEVGEVLLHKIKANKNKKLITIRLYPEQIEFAKKHALVKKIGYQTLLSDWIQQGIEREQGKPGIYDRLTSIDEKLKLLIDYNSSGIWNAWRREPMCLVSTEDYQSSDAWIDLLGCTFMDENPSPRKGLTVNRRNFSKSTIGLYNEPTDSDDSAESRVEA